MPSTDKHWERFGKEDPYHGVISYDRFKKENLTEQARAEFFRSGEEHINFIMKVITRYLDANFNPSRCLDFGCGVGRLVIPMARQFKQVVGVDVSKSMLEEARRNCREFDIENVEFVESDDELSKLQGEFDFIHSYIVFQHIPVQRGLKLLKRLIELLSKGGIAALDFTYFRDASLIKKFLSWVTKTIPLAHNFANLIKGRRFNHPHMQMESYNLNWLFQLLQRQGCKNLHMQLLKLTAEFSTVYLFIQKEKV